MKSQVQAFACGSAIRQLLARYRMGEGQDGEEALSDQEHGHRARLSLPPVKIHCPCSRRRIKAAIGDWKKKHASKCRSTKRPRTNRPGEKPLAPDL